eukprot:TRINITY_DN80059_c0_g1_i1.p1 TRINITY_DN80059_c0_g1~~TRINITY_DN80059_c0_g1_i1.p1  ORF type:complete len:283 (-),score=37.91 TRINITY_DN80059_c0_g1_i1:75-923(-)
MTEVDALSCSLPGDSTLVRSLGRAATQTNGILDQSLNGTSKLIGIAGASHVGSAPTIVGETTVAATAPVKDVLLETSNTGTWKEAMSVLKAARISPGESFSLSGTSTMLIIDEAPSPVRLSSVASPLSEDLYDSYNSFPDGKHVTSALAGQSNTALSESSWMAASAIGGVSLDYIMSRTAQATCDAGTLPAAFVQNGEHLEGSLSMSHSLDSSLSLTNSLNLTTDQSKRDEPIQLVPTVHEQKLEAFSLALHGAKDLNKALRDDLLALLQCMPLQSESKRHE